MQVGNKGFREENFCGAKLTEPREVRATFFNFAPGVQGTKMTHWGPPYAASWIHPWM